MGGGQAGRPGADDGHLLGLALLDRDGREVPAVQHVVGGIALQGADGQRLVELAAAALPLAGMGADPAADDGERVFLAYHLIGVGGLPFLTASI